VQSSATNGIDLTSFLFGYVPGKTDDKDEFNTAWKGRITIDDAEVDDTLLSSGANKKSYVIPDLNNQDAFMGGPHPSASSWWYQKPYSIIRDEYGVYKLMGVGFRGRKFYFHQDPKKGIQEYRDVRKWGFLNFFQVQCLEKGRTITFDIYFNNIPEQILNLIIFSLEPGKRIRHKIGYGKAYGYGSIELTINNIVFCKKGFDCKPDAVDLNVIRKTIAKQVDIDKIQDECSIANLFHKPSLDALSFILWYDTDCLFTYPNRAQGGFNHTMSKDERKRYADTIKFFLFDNKIKLGTVLTTFQSVDLSQQLYQLKPALNFTLYQQRSRGNVYFKLKEKRKLGFECLAV